MKSIALSVALFVCILGGVLALIMIDFASGLDAVADTDELASRPLRDECDIPDFTESLAPSAASGAHMAAGERVNELDPNSGEWRCHYEAAANATVSYLESSAWARDLSLISDSSDVKLEFIALTKGIVDVYRNMASAETWDEAQLIRRAMEETFVHWTEHNVAALNSEELVPIDLTNDHDPDDHEH